MLFLPYISGLLLGFPAFIGWVFLAAAVSHKGQYRTGGQGIREAIIVLMAGAGAWLGHPPASSVTFSDAGADSIVRLEGTISDGPWPVKAYGVNKLLFFVKDSTGGLYRITAAGSPDESVVVGDCIRITGRFTILGRSRLIETDATLIHKITIENKHDLFRSVYLFRKKLWFGLSGSLQRKPASLVATMLLGIPGQVDPYVRELFQKTGTAHLLAISGLHMGMITFMLVYCLSRLGLSEPHRLWLMIPMLGFFCLLTGCKIPVLRACIVSVFYLLSARMHRHVDPFDPLIMVCLILLLIQPQAVFELSFQLSFAGYAAILVFMRLKKSLPITRFCIQGVSNRNHPGIEVAARFLKGVMLLLGVST
ncbi:MAG: ComEC/Rec2 family competence protein, partial [Planctomycetota bacterium]